MANFQNNAITARGILLRSHVDMGAVFTATKIVMGSGYIPAGKTAKTITEVVAPVKELTINKKERSNDGKVIFGGAYTNEGIDTEFYFRELALYAKAVYPDGTEVDEVLYCYGNAEDSAELMAAYSTSTAVERQMDVVTYVGNEAQIDLTIASGLYIPRDEKGVPGGVAALDDHGSLDIEGGVYIAKSRGAFVADENSTIMEHRKDGNRFGFVVYPDMPIEERYKVFDEIAGVIRQYDVLHSGLTTVPRYVGLDFTNDLNKFAGYRSGTFTAATTANIPDPIHPFYDVWNSSGSGRFYTQFASVVNDDITYYRKYYDGKWTDWQLLLTSAGDSTIDGSLSVNFGSGTLLSWILEDETGTAMDAYLDNKIARLKVVRTPNFTKAYLVGYDGSAWGQQYELLHTGNMAQYMGVTQASLEE